MRLMHSSKSARSALPLVGSWASTVAASAASWLALASFAFALALAFGRGRVEGATGLKVASTLVVV
jgi:hypothetical protein